MTVITTFFEKQRKKQWNFERKVLRKLSLVEIRNSARTHFEGLFSPQLTNHPYIEDYCIDLAIDAYLLGAEYSRFGYYGETIEQVRSRNEKQLHQLTDRLMDFFDIYTEQGNELKIESMYVTSSIFIIHWWEEGFREGEKRYRLRLH